MQLVVHIASDLINQNDMILANYSVNLLKLMNYLGLQPIIEGYKDILLFIWKG